MWAQVDQEQLPLWSGESNNPGVSGSWGEERAEAVGAQRQVLLHLWVDPLS